MKNLRSNMARAHTSTKTRVNYSEHENIESVVDSFMNEWILNHVAKHHPDIIKQAEDIKKKCMEDIEQPCE